MATLYNWGAEDMGSILIALVGLKNGHSIQLGG